MLSDGEARLLPVHSRRRSVVSRSQNCNCFIHFSYSHSFSITCPPLLLLLWRLYFDIISRTQSLPLPRKTLSQFSRFFLFSFAVHFSIGFVGLLLFNLLLLESLLLLLVEYTQNLRNFQSNSHHTIQSPSTYRENSLYFQLRIILWIVPQKNTINTAFSSDDTADFCASKSC